ncbi:MAG: LysM peptidoglycan-binding domain-containing protein [Clostridia bacterium]|nr:LysM peptidoglycan-binding domain-containing protein [Clostridia bacterium]
MWYTVQPGDTLFSISQRFGTSVEQITSANQIANQLIYIGQNLFIPLQERQQTVYTVKPGDSIYLIARRYNTTVESIVALNNLTTTSLTVGQQLIIPQYTEVQVKVDTANIRRGPNTNTPVEARMVRGARLPVLGTRDGWYKVRLFNGRDGWILEDLVDFYTYSGRRPITEIFGFYTLEEGPALPSSFSSFVNNTTLLSELGLFMFRIDRNNPTQIEKFGTFSDRDVETLVAIAHRNNIKILPVVHNLLYRPGGVTASKDVVKQLVSTQQNRRAFAQNLVRLIERYNFDGVNIDIEDVYIEDSPRLSLLYAEIANALRPKGYYFSASVPARVSDQPFNPFSDPFNYSAIGRAVDQFAVMLYNEHGWPGSPPGPPVSIGWMERVLRYTITKMPRQKVIAAVSVFGFDFNITTGRNRYVTYEMATQLADKYNSTIIFDERTKTPMFTYTDEQGDRHEVWYENSQSIRAKIDLAEELGISGLALWRLGMEDPNMWTMLSRDVVVKKII